MQPIQRQRAHRSGYLDSEQGGIIGIDGAVALPLLPVAALNDASASFQVRDVQMDPNTNTRLSLIQFDGVRSVELLRTERKVGLETLRLTLQAFTGLNAQGNVAIAPGGGDRGSVSIYAHELPKSGLGPRLLPQPSVIAGNPATLDFGTPHGLKSGDLLRIVGNGSTPSLDGELPVTVTTTNRVTVPVNVTVAVDDGLFLRDGILDNEGNIVARATTAGEANATVYVPLMCVERDWRIEIDLVHCIAANAQDCSIVLASDAAGADEVEIGKSINGRAVFNRRRLLVNGSDLGSEDGVFILLKAISGGTPNASHALITARRLQASYDPVRSFSAAATSPGTNALGTVSLLEVADGETFEIERCHLDPGTMTSAALGVADNATGTNFVPLLTASGDPESRVQGALVKAEGASRFILVRGWKTTAGAGAGSAAIDGRYWN